MDLTNSNQREATFYLIADETGFPKETIEWIAGAICMGSHGAPDGSTNHVGARALCALLVSDINVLHPGNLEGALRGSGIASSRDVGRIVFALVGKEIVRPDESDAEADFSGVFDTERIDPFLAEAGITRIRYDLKKLKRRISWLLYAIGIAIVLLSYGNFVSPKVGWGGWAVGMVGFALFYLPDPKYRRFPVAETKR